MFRLRLKMRSNAYVIIPPVIPVISASTTAPVVYWNKVCITKSNVNPSVDGRKTGFSTHNEPINILPYKISGIMGGILMLAAIMTKALFNRKKIAVAIAMSNWKPQMGTIPINNPKPTENAFNAGDSCSLSMDSRTFCQKLFFLMPERNHGV